MSKEALVADSGAWTDRQTVPNDERRPFTCPAHLAKGEASRESAHFERRTDRQGSRGSSAHLNGEQEAAEGKHVRPQEEGEDGRPVIHVSQTIERYVPVHKLRRGRRAMVVSQCSQRWMDR
jgi:hypothetical protein